MQTLSERLKIIASFVPKGTAVTDVGTDHGYLPAALCLSGDYKSVTATDVREKPLQNAKKNLEKLSVKGVDLVLCNGLMDVPEKKAETVIIAGMGGDVISGIIDRCPYKTKPLFILQPMTAAGVLREYLAKNGFCVLRETAVCENSKIYSVMVCKFDGENYELTPCRKRIGILKPTNENNTAYIKKQSDILKKCISQMENAGKFGDISDELKSAKTEIDKILEG